ncbi:MAG: cytochrome c-type biogenesis protein CcmH [Pseudohongiellaceae bacterium]|jgi:cytochrome c-type biogenesis protein CcmH
MSLRKSLATWVLILLPLSALAAIETYQFNSPEMRVRYQQFTHELRCPKCQNQNLSGSNSPISKDLRRELHRLLHEGYSDQQISDHMVDRYGEFVLYRPPVNKHTLVLWLAPAVLLLISVIVVVLIIRKQGSNPIQNNDHNNLNKINKNKLARLLMDAHDQKDKADD